VRIVQAPTAALEQEVLAKVPGVRSDQVELAVAFPPGFDPSRPHPILVTQVTASFRPNLDELSAYAPTALEQGYVVLTAQVSPWLEGERGDPLLYRYVALRAALRWLAAEAPGSGQWPLFLAGFSGGAKISQALAFSLMMEGRSVAGLFLGGCNEAHARVLLGEYPGLQQAYSQIAIFLSVGREDRIAPLTAVRGVAEELRKAGTQRLELSTYAGGHRLELRELEKALSWFRGLPAPGAS
jgi:predicted esterase